MSRSVLTRTLPQLMVISAAILVVPGLGVFASTSESGKVGGKYRFEEVSRSIAIKATPDYPLNPGSHAILAVMVRSERTFAGSDKVQVGRGMQRFYNEITGHPTPTTWTFESHGTGFFPGATIKKRQHGTATLEADGSVTYVGEGQITGGTGERRGTKAHYTFKGSSPTPTTPAVFEIQGAGVYSDR